MESGFATIARHGSVEGSAVRADWKGTRHLVRAFRGAPTARNDKTGDCNSGEPSQWLRPTYLVPRSLCLVELREQEWVLVLDYLSSPDCL